MKICFIVPRFHTNLITAIESLNKRGFETQLLCLRQEDIEIHDLATPIIINGKTASWRNIYKTLAKLKPDFIIIRPSQSLSRRVFWLSKLLKIPRIGYHLKPCSRSRSMVQLIWEAFLQGLPREQITPVRGFNNHQGNRASRHLTYLPLPVSVPPDVNNRQIAPNGTLRILCVAKLNQPRKRHLLLLQALRNLDEHIDYQLTMIGASSGNVSGFRSDYYPDLISFINGNLAVDKVNILQDFPPSEMTSQYLNHDIVVLPADREPLGIAPLEGMACGCVPIVSSDVGSAGTISESAAGVVFQRGDAEELAVEIKRLALDPDLLRSLSNRAISFSRSQLSGERFTDGIVSIYKRVQS